MQKHMRSAGGTIALSDDLATLRHNKSKVIVDKQAWRP